MSTYYPLQIRPWCAQDEYASAWNLQMSMCHSNQTHELLKLESQEHSYAWTKTTFTRSNYSKTSNNISNKARILEAPIQPIQEQDEAIIIQTIITIKRLPNPSNNKENRSKGSRTYKIISNEAKSSSNQTQDPTNLFNKKDKNLSQTRNILIIIFLEKKNGS